MKKIIKKIFPIIVWGVMVLISIVISQLGFTENQYIAYFWLEIAMSTAFAIFFLALNAKKYEKIYSKIGISILYAILLAFLYVLMIFAIKLFASWVKADFYKLYEALVLLESINNCFKGRK